MTVKRIKIAAIYSSFTINYNEYRWTDLSYTHLNIAAYACTFNVSAMTYVNLACATDREPRYDAYTYIQAHTGKDVVHDDEWSTGENFRQRHDEDGERAINFDERKKGEA